MRPRQLQLVCTFDEAIDFDKISSDEMVEYIKDRDIKKLVFRPGEKPLIFHSAAIPNELFHRLVMRQDSDSDRGRMCFRLGVHRVSKPNGDTWQPNGETKTRGGTHTLMTDDEADEWSAAEVQEIGTALYWHSFLPLRIEGVLRAPPSSLGILTQQTFRPADESPDNAEPTSGEPSAPTTSGQDKTPPSSASGARSGGSATAVSVTARG